MICPCRLLFGRAPPKAACTESLFFLNADLHIILSVIRLAPLIHAKEHTRKTP